MLPSASGSSRSIGGCTCPCGGGTRNSVRVSTNPCWSARAARPARRARSRCPPARRCPAPPAHAPAPAAVLRAWVSGWSRSSTPATARSGRVMPVDTGDGGACQAAASARKAAAVALVLPQPCPVRQPHQPGPQHRQPRLLRRRQRHRPGHRGQAARLRRQDDSAAADCRPARHKPACRRGSAGSPGSTASPARRPAGAASAFGRRLSTLAISATLSVGICPARAASSAA